MIALRSEWAQLQNKQKKLINRTKSHMCQQHCTIDKPTTNQKRNRNMRQPNSIPIPDVLLFKQQNQIVAVAIVVWLHGIVVIAIIV